MVDVQGHSGNAILVDSITQRVNYMDAWWCHDNGEGIDHSFCIYRDVHITFISTMGWLDLLREFSLPSGQPNNLNRGTNHYYNGIISVTEIMSDKAPLEKGHLCSNSPPPPSLLNYPASRTRDSHTLGGLSQC